MALVKLTRRDKRFVRSALKVRLKHIREDIFWYGVRMDYHVSGAAFRTHEHTGKTLNDLYNEEKDVLDRLKALKRTKFVEV